MIQKKALKPRKCKHCREPYTPSKPMQTACSIQCALALAQKAKEKAQAVKAKEERKADRARKEAIKSRSERAKDAQEVFNRYIRLRDADLGCISCDKPSTWPGQWHASHFRSVGAASSIRFNEYNVHKSCSVCNNYLSGNISSYRPRLIEKIGEARVLFLESQNQVVKYSIDYLIRLRRIYLKKANRLRKRRGDLQN